MKKLILICLVLVSLSSLSAQGKYFTKTAKVSFDATSPLEKIQATTNSGTLVLDATTGKIEAAVLVKSFHFEKALMEEHFNENYMESGKYPKANFAGNIADMKAVNLQKEGDYPVIVKGKLTLHNVTKDIETKGILTVKGGAIAAAKANWQIKVADYNITIPGPVKDKIAKEAKIDISGNLQSLK